jgi:uncharacterized protein (UPF0264 family)
MLIDAKASSPATRPNDHIGLLVSVRDLNEWLAIRHLPIDVIDFKEPQLGPLAAASPSLWRSAAADPSCRSMLSAALGECRDAVEIAHQVPDRFAFAKAGPAGISTTDELADAWRQLRALLHGATNLVAVAYADFQTAQCPSPLTIFRQAAATGLRTWLLDTYEKVPGNDSLSRLGPQTLRSIASLAEHASATWVLAGSISPAIAQSLTDLGIRPNLLGVRGSLCDGDRRNEIIPAKVEAWIDWLRADCTAQAAYPEQVDLSKPIAEVPARLPSS